MEGQQGMDKPGLGGKGGPCLLRTWGRHLGASRRDAQVSSACTPELFTIGRRQHLTSVVLEAAAGLL